jgi:hypothetical protein
MPRRSGSVVRWATDQLTAWWEGQWTGASGPRTPPGVALFAPGGTYQDPLTTKTSDVASVYATTRATFPDWTLRGVLSPIVTRDASQGVGRGARLSQIRWDTPWIVAIP